MGSLISETESCTRVISFVVSVEGGAARTKKVSKKYVEESLDFLEGFVAQLEAVT